METAFFSIAVAVGLMLLAWYFVERRTASHVPSLVVLPPGVAITPAPLLTEADVSVYNLMRLAVQDHYLIFAQVPLWSFLTVEAMGPARNQVLSHMALKR